MPSGNIVLAAYFTLLMLPHGGASRERMQPILAALRDEVALLLDRDPQDIQDWAERAVALGMEGLINGASRPQA